MTGAATPGWVEGADGRRASVWLGADIPQRNDGLALHSTSKTIQTVLMKCMGNCTLVNSNLFCFLYFLLTLLRRVPLPVGSPPFSLSPTFFSGPAEFVH